METPEELVSRLAEDKKFQDLNDLAKKAVDESPWNPTKILEKHEQESLARAYIEIMDSVTESWEAQKRLIDDMEAICGMPDGLMGKKSLSIEVNIVRGKPVVRVVADPEYWGGATAD